MEILNIGVGEFLVIIILALIVFRPSDIYQWMRMLGKWTAKARRAWREFVDTIETEIPDDIKEEVDNVRQLGKETQETVKDSLQTSQELINESVTDLKKVSSEARKDLNESADSANTSLKESLRSGIAAAQQAGEEGDDNE